MNDGAQLTSDQLKALCTRRPNYGFMRDMGGDGPGEISPEEMVEDLIDECGENIEQSLKSELDRAIENKESFEIAFWKATLGYLARRNGRISVQSRPRRNQPQPVTLAAKWDVRVRDLCSWHVLQIKCFQCDAKAWLYPSSLKGRYSDYQRLIDLERKFRCTKCGNASLNSWGVFQLPRD